MWVKGILRDSTSSVFKKADVTSIHVHTLDVNPFSMELRRGVNVGERRLPRPRWTSSEALAYLRSRICTG